MSIDSSVLLPQVNVIAEQAARIIMDIYHNGITAEQIQHKVDNSPVTVADLASHAYIVNALAALTPSIPIVSEETALPDVAIRRQWTHYWLVDPLDGTKEFIDHNGEFTINIALIEDGCVVLGVVYLPAVETCYYAYAGGGAYKQVANGVAKPIHARRRTTADELIILTSRRNHSQRVTTLADRLPHARIERYGSAIKLCFLAEGQADVYTRFGNVLEWDLAAGHCIIEQAGGCVSSIAGTRLIYNTPQLEHPNFFAVGCCDYPWQSYLVGISYDN